MAWVEAWQEWLAQGLWMETLLALGAVVLASVLADLVARRVLLGIVKRVVEKSRSDWDDVLHSHQVFERLAHLLPTMVVYYGIHWVPNLSEPVAMVIQRVTVASLVVIALSAISAFLRAANEIYSANPDSRHRPIKGYLQILQIAIYLLGGISVLAILMDRSPLVFLSGVGAMTAVLMLVFKDTILSLVASVQLTSNGMVAVGDWIEMPAFGADGDVIDIALHTIKVQNWDKTITTIPTHKLIDNSFKNWKGMSESGGRRIKRSLQLDMGTVRFLNPEEIERFSHFELLRDYIAEKKAVLEEENRGQSASDIVANARQLTNVGTFRAYVVNYLRQHPKIHQAGMTFLVRQLAPTPEGVPIEVYVFSSDTDWVNYEGIQSDLFDHLLAIAPEFGLAVYQRPSGTDMREALQRTS